MPKPVKKRPSPSSDPNRRVHQMMAEHLERVGASDTPAPDSFEIQYKAHMSKLGMKGGKIGGKRRMGSMTDREKSALGLKAATARWSKERARKKRREK